eukprot:TRINITY_DN36165_c0_g1_i1.p1 TRINITY_DN36165_c0_g1~~TRINITY_DN36165_c0_g1_i1.p1  ORF type:complete len:709 (+),score=83.20 TRINITY_DN36165_c0_g1_i1:54-2180(+)
MAIALPRDGEVPFLTWNRAGHPIVLDAEDLRCSKYPLAEFRDEGPVTNGSRGWTSAFRWDELRQNLTFYSAMSLASEHIMADAGSDIHRNALAAWRLTERYAHIGDQCMLGFLTLKLLAFMSLEDKDKMSELGKKEGATIHQVLTFLCETLDWHLVARSGWPLFRFLARVQTQAVPFFDQYPNANPFNMLLESKWQGEIPFLQRVDAELNSWRPVPAADSAFVVSYPETSCFAKALALFALADTLRPPHTEALAAGTTDRLVRRAVYSLHECWHGGEPWHSSMMISLRWPLFRVVDRLACTPEIELRLPIGAAHPRPLFSVLPVREKISDAVRACSRPYCDLSFIELLVRVMGTANAIHDEVAGGSESRPAHGATHVLKARCAGGGILHLTEVGANLGDCTVFAAAHFGPCLRRAVALEPLPLQAATLRRSVSRNWWLQDAVRVVEAAASDRSGFGRFHLLGHLSGNPFGHASGRVSHSQRTQAPVLRVRTTTLDKVLPRSKFQRGGIESSGRSSSVPVRPVSVLKLWSYGDLLTVLRGAPRDFGARVSAVWLAFAVGEFPSPEATLMRLLDFFVRRGFSIGVPSMDQDWCAGKRSHGELLRRLRRYLLHGPRVQQPVITLIAFRRGRLLCPPLVAKSFAIPPQSLSTSKGLSVTSSSVVDSGSCWFGQSLRQIAAQWEGVGYDDWYFLGAEVRAALASPQHVRKRFA